jgi:hypothetical protein
VAVSQGISQSSVNYRKVGLELEVVPYFMSGDRVSLAVNQSNGLIGSQVDLGNGSAPIIESQRVKTSVQLKIGQSIVLGGVATDRVRTVRGLLRNTEEKQSGFLYVVLATVPARPLTETGDSPSLMAPAFSSPPPSSVGMESPAEWVDSQLLPAIDWQKQESDFLRSYPPASAKASAVEPPLAPVQSVRKPRFARKK